MPLGYLILSKVVPCPLPSYFKLFSWAPSGPTMLTLQSSGEEQPENRWPLEDKYCIISNPSRYSDLHFPCFLQHVQQQHLSENKLCVCGGGGGVTDTQCLLEVHLLVASLQGQFGFQGCLPLWELAWNDLGPNPYHPSPKVTPRSNLHSTFMEHLVCFLLSICF